MSRIDVITFDLDNTLWDVDEVIRNAERVTRQWFDARIPELYATLKQEDFMAIRQRIVVDRPELAHDLSRIREVLPKDGAGNWPMTLSVTSQTWVVYWSDCWVKVV